ncbi:MAG: hypothetical protein HY014_12920 [Acidobacteria bacterium]|nr:hypothetical protein [Acidobacteriota bacterium]MBI3489056.1 hypothetical protein [Acidobacteriota bacterium]
MRSLPSLPCAALFLPAFIAPAQEPSLPALLARLQALSTDQLRGLQARLALDPAPADKKAYHELHLAYALASRLQKEDPKTAEQLTDRALKSHEASRDPEIQILMGAFLGLKIGFSPMSAMVLSPKAMGRFERALAQQPGNPRALLFKAIHTLHMPAFVGGGAEAALPLAEEAARRAAAEPAPADPWAPAWGRVESLGWLAYIQAKAGKPAEARATASRALALDPGNPFVTRQVLPLLKDLAS